MNWLDNLAKKSKNLVVKITVQRFFRKYINRILELSIDNQRHKFHATNELKGEEKPITIDIEYELSINEHDSIVQAKAHNILISKEWMNLIAQEALHRDYHISGKGTVRIIKLIRKLGIA
jgi:predicted alpha/beta-fold hydrolase